MSQCLTADTAPVYWEQRARQFAARGDGLAAVCAYGMPRLYNWAIHYCQLLALRPWLSVEIGARVLDVGCGIGRWSRILARQGALVTGIDLSPTMVAIARHHAESDGLLNRCHFFVEDLAQLDVDGDYDMVLGVTVLQHILEPARLRMAVSRMTAHLAPRGRMVLLEAAPLHTTGRCESNVFTARDRRAYVDLFRACGLRIVRVVGVDPMPFKIWLLPYLRDLPRAVRFAAVTAASAVSLPFDALMGRWAVARSWHVVFVLEHESEGHHDD